MNPRGAPDPCTAEAREAGCTCRMESVNSASIDPPEPIIDRYCPVHAGYDPDRALQEARDDAIDFPEPAFDGDDA